MLKNISQKCFTNRVLFAKKFLIEGRFKIGFSNEEYRHHHHQLGRK